jgi:DeoR/GlpR family transcriptional regulator of sugar metabolism
MLDSTKWGNVASATFAELSQVNQVISSRHAPADLVDRVRQQGVEVVLV